MKHDDLLKKVNDLGVNIISDKDDLVILKIDNFEQSKELGSKDWAISRLEDYFHFYKRDDQNQYFAYDLTKKDDDRSALIGITMNEKKFMTAHYSDCEYIELDDKHLERCMSIIKESYPTIDNKVVTKSRFKNKM